MVALEVWGNVVRLGVVSGIAGNELRPSYNYLKSVHGLGGGYGTCADDSQADRSVRHAQRENCPETVENHEARMDRAVPSKNSAHLYRNDSKDIQYRIPSQIYLHQSNIEDSEREREQGETYIPT